MKIFLKESDDEVPLSSVAYIRKFVKNVIENEKH